MNNIQILPVTKDTVQETLALIHTIFPKTTPIEDPDVWFSVSIDPQKHADVLKKYEVKDVRYFVVLHTDSNKIIGTTGLYHLLTDSPGIVWLGWYCIHPEYRKKGIGKYVLQWTIDKAKQEGENVLRLYTSTEENKAAQIVYDKFGFETTGTEEKDGEIVTYKQRLL